MPKGLAEELHLVYLAKGAHATTAIEGNSLTEEEVRLHLDGQLQLPASRDYLTQEVDNLVNAFDTIVGYIAERGPAEQLTPELICRINAAILEGLELEEGVVAGAVRSHSAGVGRYRGAPPEDCEFLLDALCQWLNETQLDADGALGSAAAIVKAVLAHLYIAWIHPFGDGNGRTARLVEFYLLVNAGVPVASAHLLSDHYNQTRSEYYRQLDYASKSHGDVIPFILYAVKGFVEELKNQLALIRRLQWKLAWKNLVGEYFASDKSAAGQRRRELLLDLSDAEQPIPRGQLALISARVARAYARVSEKTLDRDLAALVEAGLVERSEAGYRARREIILAFLPPAWPKAKDKAAEGAPR